MATVDDEHGIEERVSELEREEESLERRTDGYQWNHAIALAASTLAVIVAFAALAVALTRHNGMSGSGALMSVSQQPAAPAAPAASSGGAGAGSAASTMPMKTITMAIKADSKLGADGNRHDAFVPSADLTVKAGQMVRVTVANYDDMPHSFTSPALAAGAAIPASEQQRQGSGQDLTVMPGPGVGVDANIAGGSDKSPRKSTFVFTAPSKPGTYVYYCKLPCDPWAMAHFGYMMGHIKVTKA